MIIDLDCPLELRGYEILHDDGENVRAYIDFFNILDKRISQFDAVIRWIASEYGESEEVAFFADQLRASARTVFQISVSTQNMPLANRLEIYFLRICFEDESPDWIGDPERLIEIDMEEEIDGRTLNTLMALTGRDAVRFPRKTSDYWICVCGHVNASALAQCRRCRRNRDTVLTSLSREAVLLEKAPPLPELLMPEAIEPDLPLFEEEPSALEAEDDDLQQEAEDLDLSDVPSHPLLRNIVFLVALITLLCASLWLFLWLDSKSTRAKDVRPPVKTTPEAQSITLRECEGMSCTELL